jgi:NAD(P)H dehydrogenase (quinone)
MPKIAVTGASGKLGGLTIEFLLERGVPPADIIAVVRDVTRATALAARGVELRRGDYTDAPSLEQAFRGIDRLAFISTSALGDERMLHHGNVVKAARNAGIPHIFYTSVIKPAAEARFAASPGHFHTERLIRESGITHTFLRNNLYMDLVPLMFGSAVATGRLAHNGADGRVGFIARSDVALALAAVLSSEGHGNRDYAITAPQPYGLADVARGLARASGKSVTYEILGSQDFRLLLESIGVPPAGVGMAVALGDAIRAGEFDAQSGDVGKLTGRTPVTLDTFLARALGPTS